MKTLFLILFSISSYAHHGNGAGGVGSVGTNLGNNGVPVVFPIPITIMLDGSTEFGWDWWGFAPHHTHEATTVHTHEETNVDMNHEHEADLSWYFSPLLFVNGDKFKVFINLQEQITDKSILLEEGEPQSGYLVLEKGRLELGPGVGAHLPLASGIMVGAGLLPLGGVSVYSERYAPNLEAAQKMPKLKFPKDASFFDSWSKNDLMVYTKKAGITFFGHAGFSGLSSGLGYSAQGEWVVSLKKTADEKIVANVSKVKLQSLSAFAGLEFSTLNLSLFGGQDKAFNFEFDLANKSGQESFNEFLKGNFKFTKHFGEGVRQISESQGKIFGRAFGIHMNLPFLASLDFNKSMVKSFSQVQNFKDNQKVENTMAVYSKTMETAGVLSRRTSDVTMFAVSHQQLVNTEKHEGHDHNGPKANSFTTANIKLMFSRMRVKDHVFQRELEDIKRVTGLWNSLDFELPQDKLGYVKLEFDGMISSKGTEALLKMGPNASLVAQDKIEQFFENDSDPNRICEVRNQSCKKFILKTTSKALKKMSQKLTQMQKFAALKNWKSFTETYAQLGKEAMTNQFTFQTFLKSLGKDNFSMEFKVSGEKLKTIHIHQFAQDPIF